MVNTYFSYTLLVVVTVDLLATTGDVTLSWTSPIYPKLYSNDTSINPLGTPITEDEDAWIGSLVTIGAIIGPIPFGFISEHFGRKIGLLCIGIPHIVSFFTMAFAKNIYLFYFGRLFGGLSLGGGFTLLPMYIAEISKDSNRGTMSQTLNVFWSIGNFVPYAIGPFISIKLFNIVLGCIAASFFVSFLLLAPETPYYLVGMKELKKAEASLMLLRSSTEEGVQRELNDIKAYFTKEENGNFSDIFKNRVLRKALVICVILVMAQELSGFCAITFYLQPIFEAAGTSLSSDFSALTVGLTLLVSSFVAPLLIDRIGVRILIICSCFGMFLALLILGIFFYIKDSTNHSTDPILWIPIFSLIFYIISFNLGMGSIPWTLSSELFPNNVKNFSASTISSACWITSFLVTKFFNDMNDTMGRAGSFWFFATACLACTVFCILYVPETKKKSFSEIQDMLELGFLKKKKSISHEKDALK